jgi:hypothetical protein
MITAVAFGLMLIAAFIIIPRRIFRGGQKYRDEYSLKFSPVGIHFRTARIDSQLQWGMYSQALVDNYSYLLYYSSRPFTVVPKRVFQNIEQQQAFEQLLTQRNLHIVRR